jgi:hypothetical protein
LQVRLRGGGLHADINLGVGDLDAEIDERLQVAGKVLADGGLTDGEMGLETDAVDLGTVGLDEFDDVLGTGGLGATPFDAVVIVVELNIWVGGSGSLEGNGDVGLADCFVPDGVSVGAVVIEGYFCR